MNYTEDENHELAYLNLAERYGHSSDLVLEGDLLITVSNAEPRCVEILSANLSAFDEVQIIRFHPHGALERRAAHHNILRSALLNISNAVVEPDPLPIQDFRGWCERLELIVTTLYFKLKRQLSIVIDVSCFPKHYILSVMGFCVEHSVISKIQFYYAEAVYDVNTDGVHGTNLGQPKFKFSDGEWLPIIVPYFEGDLALEGRTRIIASLGLETLEARKFIRSYQAERYAVVLPSSDPLNEYAAINEREGTALAADLDIPQSLVHRCKAGSAVCISRLLSTSLKTQEGYSDTIMCLGTKPHAIGIGFYALANKKTSIVCRMPSSYVVSSTSATGFSWVFEIKDKSSFDNTNSVNFDRHKE